MKLRVFPRARHIAHFEMVPEFRGSFIYFLIRDEKIVYVGKTSSLGARVGSHHRSKKFDSARYVHWDASEHVDLTEQAFIRYFQPEYNSFKAFGPFSAHDARILKTYGINDFADHTIASLNIVERDRILRGLR